MRRSDSKTYEFPYKEIHKVISVKTRCEKVIGNPKQLNNGIYINKIFPHLISKLLKVTLEN